MQKRQANLLATSTNLRYVMIGWSLMTRTLRRPLALLIAASAMVALQPTAAFPQEVAPDKARPEEAADTQSRPDEQQTEHHRILWIIPNFRSSPTLKDYEPLSAKQKFMIATDDSLDPGTFALGAAFGIQGEWTASAPSFGHGVRAYPRYYVSSLSDFIVGDFMTEAVFPTLLRHDPRYFRRGTGGGWTRLGYALGQIVWTHSDAGNTRFNLSEIAGNATAVAIGNAYYPDNRTVASNVSKFAVQIGVDAVGNILKEFAPELERVFSRRRAPEPVRP
jgi:hypothetical protein